MIDFCCGGGKEKWSSFPYSFLCVKLLYLVCACQVVLCDLHLPPPLFLKKKSYYPNFNVNALHYLSRLHEVGSLKGRDVDNSLKKLPFVVIISSLVMRLQSNLYWKILLGLSHSVSSLLQTSYICYRTTAFYLFSKCSFNYNVVLPSRFNLTWPAHKLPISVYFIIS